MPVLIALAGILLIAGFTLFLIGLAFEVFVTFKFSLVSLVGIALFLVAVGFSLAAAIAAWQQRRRENYCLYEIATSPCRQERWQPGKQLCAVCPDDGKCVETASIEVWDIAPGELPAETSPRCTITLRRVRPECGECPQGVPIIGVVEPCR